MAYLDIEHNMVDLHYLWTIILEVLLICKHQIIGLNIHREYSNAITLLTSLASGPYLCPVESGSSKYIAIMRGLYVARSKNTFHMTSYSTFDFAVNPATLRQYLFSHQKELI